MNEQEDKLPEDKELREIFSKIINDSYLEPHAAIEYYKQILSWHYRRSAVEFDDLLCDCTLKHDNNCYDVDELNAKIDEMEK